MAEAMDIDGLATLSPAEEGDVPESLSVTLDLKGKLVALLTIQNPESQCRILHQFQEIINPRQRILILSVQKQGISLRMCAITRL